MATYLSQMTEKLTENQERAEEFDQEFLKGQTEVVEALKEFNTGEK